MDHLPRCLQFSSASTTLNNCSFVIDFPDFLQKVIYPLYSIIIGFYFMSCLFQREFNGTVQRESIFWSARSEDWKWPIFIQSSSKLRIYCLVWIRRHNGSAIQSIEHYIWEWKIVPHWHSPNPILAWRVETSCCPTVEYGPQTITIVFETLVFLGFVMSRILQKYIIEKRTFVEFTRLYFLQMML